MQLFAKLKKIYVKWVQSHLKFSKIDRHKVTKDRVMPISLYVKTLTEYRMLVVTNQNLRLENTGNRFEPP